MERGINVLSLFDGISCGRVALERAGIKVNRYFSSEIKKEAIKVSKHNYPDIIQLGDIKNISVEVTQDGTYIYSGDNMIWCDKIDLVLSGFPCKDLSNANKEKLGLKGQQSGLFYEALRIAHECSADYFLFENVVMKKDQQTIIDRLLGVQAFEINSSLVSAQLRRRLYWTNIPGLTAPDNKNILFKDILDAGGYTNKQKGYCILESESRPNTCNWKRFRRHRKKGFVNIVFTDPQFNIFRNRPLSQRELERMQTLPEYYTEVLSRNEAAGVIGDGWTVDVIAHILKGLKDE